MPQIAPDQPMSNPGCKLHNDDCLKVLPQLDAASVDLVVTDPPYFKVKGEAWDRQWDKPDQFLQWLDTVLVEIDRVLKPNGSVYLFASPQMACRVEVLMSERFNVLNSIRWLKDEGWHKRQKKEEMRRYATPWEACIFAESNGSDTYARGESQYAHKCDELRGFLFEPLRKYLHDEMEASGYTVRMVAEAYQKKTGSRTVTGMAGHWFHTVQWVLPTEENYNWLRELFNGQGLSKPYEELRQEYEELRQEYEELRRPFYGTAERQTEDIWRYDPVAYYPGKHPCQKPHDMLCDIIETSSKPDAVVLDCFMGTGSTGIACKQLGRRFVGVELDGNYYRQAAQRIDGHCEAVAGRKTINPVVDEGQLSMFEGVAA